MPQLKMIFDAETTPLPELTVAPGFSLRTIADSELVSSAIDSAGGYHVQMVFPIRSGTTYTTTISGCASIDSYVAVAYNHYEPGE